MKMIKRHHQSKSDYFINREVEYFPPLQCRISKKTNTYFGFCSKKLIKYKDCFKFNIFSKIHENPCRDYEEHKLILKKRKILINFGVIIKIKFYNAKQIKF